MLRTLLPPPALRRPRPAAHARVAACLAGVLLALGASPPAHGEGAILPEAEQPAWNAIGRVNIAGMTRRRMCTGTLVAPDTVLTAAHCVLEAGDIPAQPGEVVFAAGWRGGAPAADARAIRLRLHPRFEAGLAAGEIRVLHDLALLTLPAPLEGFAPIATGPLPAGDPEIAIIGYRADRPHIATRMAPCRITRRGPEAFVTDCEAVSGTSGAPVLAQTPSGWAVVGVVSATGDMGTLAPIPRAWPAVP